MPSSVERWLTRTIFHLSARGRLAEFSVDFAGSLVDSINMDGLDIGLELAGPPMLEAGAILGLNGFKDVPYAFKGRLSRLGDYLALDDAVMTGRDLCGRVSQACRG